MFDAVPFGVLPQPVAARAQAVQREWDASVSEAQRPRLRSREAF